MADDEKMQLYELQAEIIETQERLKELTEKEKQLDAKVNNIPLNKESIVVSTDLKLFEGLLKAFDEQWSKRFSTMEDALQLQRVEMVDLKIEQWKKEEKYKQNNEQFLRLQKIIEKQSQSIEDIQNGLTKIKEDYIKILPKSDEKKKEEPTKKKGRMKEGIFNMDNFKRIYSNEDTATKAIPHLWENFDSENNSIWKCEYKFPEELTLTFMSCILISGMYQRLEKLKKNAFASMILFGTDNNSTISGIWIWRGQEPAFPLSPDWQVDYESYEWKKLDPKSEETKKEVNEYLLWEGDFGGKKFNQGKIFK